MRLKLLATASAFALSTAASAGAPPPVPAVWNWTGAYAGFNAGAAWHKTTYDVIDLFNNTMGSFTKADATIGGQIGYNWQQQNYVYGIEGDLNAFSARGTTPFPLGSDISSKLTWLGTIRGRAGILIAAPTLLYATGGLAVGAVDNYTAYNGSYTDNSTRVGWTGGGGVEHKLTERWSAKAEALYVDLGSKTVIGAAGAGYTGKFTNTAVISRFGFNYKW